jgi:hypothetical protein
MSSPVYWQMYTKNPRCKDPRFKEPQKIPDNSWWGKRAVNRLARQGTLVGEQHSSRFDGIILWLYPGSMGKFRQRRCRRKEIG